MRLSQSSNLSLLAVALATAFLSPAALAQCDISQTKCALNGGKCNIKFKNRTGDTGGSEGGTNINQTSSAQTVAVKAMLNDGTKAGNKLNIPAGSSKTMNIEKKAKKNFDYIEVRSADIRMVKSSHMSCADIKAVLNGNGTCKAFHGGKSSQSGAFTFYIGYQCDGGNVAGPTDATSD